MTQLEQLELASRLQRTIQRQENLPLPHAALLAHMVLTTFDPRVLEGVKSWLDETLTDDFAVGDLNLGEIRSAYGGCSAFVALHVMNLCLTDPDALYDYTWAEGVDYLGT